MLFVQVGGQLGVLAAVGGLGELKMRMVVACIFTRQVLVLCLPSCHVPSSLVARVLLSRGTCVPWGSERQCLSPCGTQQGGQAAACLAISQGKWHRLGQRAPLLLEHIRGAQLSCSWSSFVSCRVPGLGGWQLSLPCGPPALAFPCVQHHWGLSRPVEPRGCVSRGAAPALPQGLGRRKQARVKGEGWCGAPAFGQPRMVPAVISVLFWSGWCHPLCPSSSQRRGAGDLGQHFGKVNAMPGLVLRLGDLLASPGSSWKAQLPLLRWCFQLGVRVSVLQWGDFRLQGSPARIVNRTNYLADERWAGGGLVVTAVFQLRSSGHSLSPTSIPQGVIKAIIMGSVNSASSCFPGSGGFLSSSLWLPSFSLWLPLLPPQVRNLAG